MKVLFIGGTGNISIPVSELAVKRGIDLYLLNRGKQQVTIEGVTTLTADINQPDQVAAALGDQHFDVVVNWIAYHEARSSATSPSFVANAVSIFSLARLRSTRNLPRITSSLNRPRLLIPSGATRRRKSSAKNA